MEGETAVDMPLGPTTEAADRVAAHVMGETFARRRAGVKARVACHGAHSRPTGRLGFWATRRRHHFSVQIGRTDALYMSAISCVDSTFSCCCFAAWMLAASKRGFK